MADNTVTTIGGLLTRAYRSGVLEAINKEASPVYKLVKKTSEKTSEDIRRRVLTKDNRAFHGVAEGGDYPTPRAADYQQYTITPKMVVSVETFTQEALIRAGASKKLTFDFVAHISNRLMKTFAQKLSWYLWNEDATGTVGVVESVNGTRVNLYAHGGASVSAAQVSLGQPGAKWFRSNDQVVFMTSAGASKVAGIIDSVTQREAYITLSADISANIAADDIVVFGSSAAGSQDNYNRAWLGIDAAIAEGGTYFGLNRSTYPVLNGTVINANSADSTLKAKLTDELMQEFLRVGVGNGKPIDKIFSTYEVWQQVYNELVKPNQRIDISREYVVGGVVQRYAPYGDFMQDPCCRDGQMYGASDWSKFEIIYSIPPQPVYSESKDGLLRLDGTNLIPHGRFAFAIQAYGEGFGGDLAVEAVKIKGIEITGDLVPFRG